ncbi:MAG: DUF5615 family PIN-like protein [Vicinamibacterales bacterium]
MHECSRPGAATSRRPGHLLRRARGRRRAGQTKDADFAALVNQFGSPPQIVLVTCGNTSNAHLRQVLGTAWPTVLLMLERGEPLVEVGDRPR